MRRGRRIAAAATGIALGSWPVLSGGIAHAGEGDDKRADRTWDFQVPISPDGSSTCTFTARAFLQEFEGSAYVFLDDEDPLCDPAGYDLKMQYTDRSGTPATAQTRVYDPGPDAHVGVSADNVEGDMVVDVTVWFEGEHTTRQRLTPK